MVDISDINHDFIYITSPSIAEQTDDSVLCTSNFMRAIEVLTRSTELALDTETYVVKELKGKVPKALDPHTSNVSLMALKSAPAEPTLVFDFLALENEPGFKDAMLTLLSTRKYLLAQNASFDCKFLKKHFGVLLTNWWCTRVASQLISNALGGRFYQAAGGNSLKAMCLNWLDVKLGGKKAEQIEDWIARPVTPEKIKYAAEDVAYLHKIKELLLPILLNPRPDHTYLDNRIKDWGLGMQEVLDLEMSFVPVEAEMEYNGLPFNIQLNNLYQNRIHDKRSKTGKLYEIAAEIAPIFGYKTLVDFTTGEETVNDDVLKDLRSSQKLKLRLSKHVMDIPNTERSIIERLLELHELLEAGEKNPFFSDEEYETYRDLATIEESALKQQRTLLSLITQFKGLAKQASMNIAKYMNVVTGRVHPNYNSLGARTGRTSSSSPNGQNINSRTKIDLFLTKQSINEIFNGDVK